MAQRDEPLDKTALQADARDTPPASVVMIFFGLAMMALIVRQSVLAGTWLDEYWQLWISNAPTGALLAERLVNDAHPPWYNLVARGLLGLGGGDIASGRLLSLLLALAAFTAGTIQLARSAGRDHYHLHALFWLIVLGLAGPTGLIELGASFRVYPWLITLSGFQALILWRAIESEAVPLPSLLFAGVITWVAIVLHYVHAVVAISIALVTIAVAWKRGTRRLAIAVVAGLAAGVLTDLATALAQLPQWRANLDFNWIAAKGGSAGPSLITGLERWALFNIILVLLLLGGMILRQFRPRDLWILAPFPVAVMTLLIIDQVTTMVVGRYVAGLYILLALGAAVGVARLATRAWQFALIGALFLGQLAFHAAKRPPIRGWDALAAEIAGRVKTCPSTQVYATSHWRFTRAQASNAARFEQPLTAFAYRTLGKAKGFKPILLEGAPIRPVTRSCPALFWAEHAGGAEKLDPAEIARRAGLLVLPGSRIDVQSGENGLLLTIDVPVR